MSCMQRGLHVIRVLNQDTLTGLHVLAAAASARGLIVQQDGLRTRWPDARGCGSSGAGSAAALGGCELEPLLAERPPRASALHAYQTKLCTVRCFGCKRVPAVSAVNGWLL